MANLSGNPSITITYNLGLASQASIAAQQLKEENAAKVLFMDTIFFPLINKQWCTLRQNIIFAKLMCPSLDENMCQFLCAIESILEEHAELEELERIMHSNLSDTSTLLYRTTIIKLKPEYELYDIILGKPRFPLAKYDERILYDIVQLLTLDTINFKKTKEYIINKYGERNYNRLF